MVKSKRSSKNKESSTEIDIKPETKVKKEENVDQKPSIEAPLKKNKKKPQKQVKSESSIGKGGLKRYFKPENAKQEKSARGVIYVGSLPHGFYEKQLEGYFGQFGKVTGVYVPKSKKTGRTKGFAFVEFFHPEVAEIAAETMNNYLMFNKLLKTKVVPPEKQRQYMFNERFKQKKHTHSESKVKKVINQKRNLLVRERDSCVTRSVRKLNRLQEHLKSLGVDYKIKVAGLHEAVTLTGIKNIDPENNETSIKEEETSTKKVKETSKKKKGKQTAKVSQDIPTPSVNVKAEINNGITTVSLPSSTPGKRVSGRSMIKVIAKQQLIASKEKVAKLVKTIGKPKIKAQKSKLKNTVNNLQQSLNKTEKTKKVVAPTSKKELNQISPKKSAPSIKKKKNTHSKLETTV